MVGALLAYVVLKAYGPNRDGVFHVGLLHLASTVRQKLHIMQRITGSQLTAVDTPTTITGEQKSNTCLFLRSELNTV